MCRNKCFDLDKMSSNKCKLEDSSENLLVDVDEFMYDLIDEVSCGLCFEVHRACKRGTIFLDETDIEAAKDFEIVNEQGLDVFGQLPSMKKQIECVCPSCQRSLAASRFAPHLEKCMGMGRISSRIASRRIASSTRKGSDADSDADDNCSEYSGHSERRARKVRRDKNMGSSKRSKAKLKGVRRHAIHKEKSPSKVDSPTITSSSDVPSQTAFESLTFDEKRSLLFSTCGVVSEHTNKMCTKSLKCPQHTDEQRRIIRQFLFDSQSYTEDDAHIDIDSLDDQSSSCSQSLWDTIASVSPSSSSAYASIGAKRQKTAQLIAMRKRTSTPVMFSSTSNSQHSNT